MDAAVLTPRFVGAQEMIAFESTFTRKEWLYWPDIVPAKELPLVRATGRQGWMYPFHMHPTREEIIYALSGCTEQGVGDGRRKLGPWDTAFIPKEEAYGTDNHSKESLVFPAILSPANTEEPEMVDVSTLESGCAPRAHDASPADGN